MTKTTFDANLDEGDEPLPLYEQRREALGAWLADAVKTGDESSVVAKAIIAGATDARPKLRHPAGPLARRVAKLRRYAPSALFDRQIRKGNQLPSPKRTTSNGPSSPRRAPRTGSHHISAGGEGQ
jgi:hypothetical protein